MKTLLLVSAMTFAGTAIAADPKPEIVRPLGKPQVVGALHTVRSFPEACARIEGRFTGQAANPYQFAIKSVGPRCAPRATLVDARKVGAATGKGWVFHDLVKVPAAACPTRMAVVRVWRDSARLAPPTLDAQGRSRVYAADAKAARQPGAVKLPQFAVAMSLEGQACN